MFLSDVSIKRPVFATMLNMVLVVFGLVGYTRLGVDQFPNVDFPVVMVRVIYPGADPKTIEQKIIDPLEKSMNGLEGLENLTSTAYPNAGVVVARFKLERSGDKAAQDVRDKVSLVQGEFPEGAKPPVVSKYEIGGAPILNLALSSKSLPLGDLSKLADDKIRPSFEQVGGVGSVELVGLRQREIHINLIRSRLEAFGISPNQVAMAIESQNLDIPSGSLENQKELIRIRTEGTMTSAASIGRIAIPVKGGARVRLADLGDVVDTIAKEETFATDNGNPAIVISVYKQSGGNTVAIAKGARQKVAELSKNLPQGVELSIVQDNSIYIEGSIDSVQFDLVLGALLAIVIVFFFLHDWRATLISACAIPTSVIGTLAFVKMMGFTLNNMTTLGLTLSIGILVDDAIVVIENIYRHLEMGKSPWDAAKEGTAEIGLAALAITLSIVAVFVPVAFMDGIVGRFFYQFGMTVAVAVMLSLFVAFTITPMMSSRMLKSHHGHIPPFFKPVEAFLTTVENFYKKILSFSLHHRWKTIGVGVGVLVLSVVLLRFVPVSFFPKEDRSQFFVNFKLKEGVSLALTKERAKDVNEFLQKFDGVERVVMSIGAGTSKTPNQARFDVNLVPVNKRKLSQEATMIQLREKLKPFVLDTKEEKMEVLAQSGGGGAAQPIQLVLQSDNFEELSQFANQLKEFLANKVPGVVDASTTEPPSVDEVKILTDPVRSADLGISTAQIGQNLNVLFEGHKVGEMDDQGTRYDVLLKMTGHDALTKDSLDGLMIPNGQGMPVALSSVATVTTGPSPSMIQRFGGQRQITVLANYTGENLQGAVGQLEEETKRTLPAGMSYQFDGQAKLMGDAVKSMGMALIFAIVLVYMVLCSQFESYLTPFVIMMSVPLAFSGAFLGLLVTQKAMSIFAMIGLIMLIGLVTKNAILLLDFTLIKMKEGLGVTEALKEAGPIRLRPILMTTLAMIFGMLPIAIGHGVGGEARAPMAACVIGGLISSTVLTLIVIPCVFDVLESLRHRIRSPRNVQT